MNISSLIIFRWEAIVDCWTAGAIRPDERFFLARPWTKGSVLTGLQNALVNMIPLIWAPSVLNRPVQSPPLYQCPPDFRILSPNMQKPLKHL